MIYDRINVMCATKGRSDKKLPQFVESALKTAAHPELLLFTFCINKNDIGTEKYLRGAIAPSNLCILYENEPECNLSLFLNMCYDNTTFKSENVAVSMFGDDMVFVTKNWDSLMLTKLNDTCGLGVVYGDDDYMQHEALSVYFISSRRLFDMTNAPFMCPHFKVDWIDTIVYRMAQKLNILEYLPYLHIAHRHALNPDVGLDKTAINMRKIAKGNPKDEETVNEYVDTLVGAVKERLAMMANRRDIAAVMTTYDRVYLLKKTLKYISESVVRPSTIHAFDDGSIRVGHVEKAITTTPGFNMWKLSHVGCEANHKRAADEMFKNDDVQWLVVIDSDSLLYKFWYVKVCDMVDSVLRDERIRLAGLFNKDDRILPEQSPDGYVYVGGCGGIGMLISRTAYRLWPTADRAKLGWDNLLCKNTVAAGYKIISPRRSYIQHTGYIEGIHANDRFDEAVAKNYCGNIPEDEPQKQISAGNRVLAVCMAHKIDCVYASLIINSLKLGGVQVKVLTIKHNINILELLCPGVTIKAEEPSSGNPNDTYSETTTYKMQEKWPGYDAYLNLQMSSRENSGLFRNSELTEIEWLKKKMKRSTAISMETGVDELKDAVSQVKEKSAFLNTAPCKKILVTACNEFGNPDIHSCSVLWSKYANDSNYDAILISDERIQGIPHKRTNQMFHQSDRNIIALVREADAVVGEPSWVTQLAKIIGK